MLKNANKLVQANSCETLLNLGVAQQQLDFKCTFFSSFHSSPTLLYPPQQLCPLEKEALMAKMLATKETGELKNGPHREQNTAAANIWRGSPIWLSAAFNWSLMEGLDMDAQGF